MKKILLLVALLPTVFSLSAQDCSTLFISEYLEGSSQNKAIEIYNPTDHTISLDGYQIWRFSNGAASNTETLEIVLRDGANEIKAYDAIVIANGQIVANDYGAVDSTLYFDVADMVGTGNHSNSPMYYNGNDAIALVSPSNLPLDLIGVIGQDPGNGWTDVDSLNYQAGDSFWLAWTRDHILVRKHTVKEGIKANPEFFNPSTEWDSLEWDTTNIDNNWVTLGSHNCDCNPTSIKNTTKSQKVTIFPNPVTSNSNVNIIANNYIKNIDLINIIGQVVSTKSVSNNTGVCQFNVGDINRGIYIIRITFKDNSNFVKRINIQ